MKASPDDQAHLLDLQTIDTRLQQLDHRAKSLPEIVTLASLSSESVTLRHELMSATGALEDAQLELTRIEADVSVVENRITRDTERMQATSSMKDVAGFEAELTGLRRRQLELEEVELEVMERVESLQAAVDHARVSLDHLEAKISEVAAERDAALRALTSERSHSAANRMSIAGTLQADLLALYERQRARYGFGATFLRGGVSSASGVKLNESDMATVRAAAADDVLMCPDSNAILVRTSESGL
jgi:predicted  nucleic acid-binding Zn-ribbon protein